MEYRDQFLNNKFGNDLKRYFIQYCKLSSIQGPSNIVKARNSIERLWWSTIFVFGIIGSFYMVHKIIYRWIEAPILVSLATKEMNIDKIPFPAITICPEAKVTTECLPYADILKARKNGRAGDYDMEQHTIFDYMASVCRPENHDSTLTVLGFYENEMELQRLIGGENISLSIDDLDYEPELDKHVFFFEYCKVVKLENSYCSWMGQTKNCSDILSPILTDQGLCYSFNMYDVRNIYSDLNTMEYYEDNSNEGQDWNPDEGFSEYPNHEQIYPRRTSLIGANNALVVVMLTENKDINYACQDFAIQGLRVSMHTAASIPRLEQVFFSVGLDRLTTVAVTPSVSETSERVKLYSPEKRYCYFGYERKLKYFNYSQSNCNFECWTNYTISKCGCVAFYMPRDNSTKDCSLRRRFCIERARLSYNADILKERLETGYGKKDNATTKCNCLPLCSDISYNAELSSGEWNFNHIDDVDLDEIREEMSKYRASAIKVFFKESYFLPTERGELHGIFDMISNICGVLSLFTGFALVSVAEIAYFVFIKSLDNYRRYNNWAGPKP
ncbi:pickpocket protein 28-like [Coccinella septempunctata]|uniref:pickpocket protein 28-like n=1 Tax=Coccinella septempunctata TaxID=41139 RepID=UPI001D094FF4|nr:pickpocket protein 28-like [Coccinella septempunctata]